MMGVSEAMTTVCASLICIEFPDDAMKFMGYFEGVSGIGFLLGPLVTMYLSFA